jgi:hypothetical protein
LTLVTASGRVFVVVVHAARGSPAAPWHSVTVTVAVAVVAVIVLTMLTSQITPRPPVFPALLSHVVAAAIVAPYSAADAPLASTRGPRSSSPADRRVARRRRMVITCS